MFSTSHQIVNRSIKKKTYCYYFTYWRKISKVEQRFSFDIFIGSFKILQMLFYHIIMIYPISLFLTFSLHVHTCRTVKRTVIWYIKSVYLFPFLSEFSLWQISETFNSDAELWTHYDWPDHESHDDRCHVSYAPVLLHPLHLGHATYGLYLSIQTLFIKFYLQTLQTFELFCFIVIFHSRLIVSKFQINLFITLFTYSFIRLFIH